MNSPADLDLLTRAMRVRALINESLRNRTPQERDRLMQLHLAQARGPLQNAWLLRQSTNAMLRIRMAQRKGSAIGPSGAKDGSHGWSTAEPVESDALVNAHPEGSEERLPLSHAVGSERQSPRIDPTADNSLAQPPEVPQ